jgi:ElaB/YqjD/DUF883 family membrane-anchored ribosome-binding protein
MKNRMPDYQAASRGTDQQSEPTSQELRDLLRKQFANRMRHAGTYVREHPVTALGAAFCVGIFLGWVIKRK